MHPSLQSIAACVFTTLVASVGAGCGDGDGESSSGEPPTQAPPAADFPEPGPGSIDEFIAEVGETNEIVAFPSGGVFTPGKTARFGFGLFDVAGPQIDDADVAVYFQDVKGGETQGPYTARTESLEVQSPYKAESALEGDTSIVYVADVPLKEPGQQRVVAVVRDSEGNFAATNFQTVIDVRDQPGIPAEGEPVPSISTPTFDDVGDVSEIDTRVPPSTMHEEDLADVLGEKPAVLLFATPALCQSRVCGPVVDVSEQVKAEYGDEAAFIHMEIYQDNQYDPKKPKLRPQVEEFGLFTEPWLFVIDDSGKVQTRIEGAFSVTELEDALQAVTG